MAVPTALTSAVSFTNATRTWLVSSPSGTSGTHVLTATAVDDAHVAIAGLTFSVNLIITEQCDPPGSVTAPTIPAVEANLDNTSYTFTWDAWTTVSPSTCTLQYSATVPSTISSAVTVDLVARTIVVKSRDNNLAGVYTIKIQALSSTGGPLTTTSLATMILTLNENKETSSRAQAQSVSIRNFVYPSVVRIALRAITNGLSTNPDTFTRVQQTGDRSRGDSSKPTTGGQDSFDTTEQVARKDMNQPSIVTDDIADPFVEAERRWKELNE